MLRSPKKISSDSDIPASVKSSIDPTVTLSYVNASRKRMRTDDSKTNQELEDFKCDIKAMISSLIEQQSSELKVITSTLKTIAQSNSEIENSMAFLSAQYEDIKMKYESLQQVRKKDLEYISILEDKVEELQRLNRKSSLEIRNVPSNKNENKSHLTDIVFNLGKTINTPISKNDIGDIYRIPTNKQINKPIIVELTTTILKTDILKGIRDFNMKNGTNKLNASHLGYNNNSPIFVTDHLTQKASRLFFLARDLSKAKSYKFCWTSYGRIFVRKDESSPIIIIRSEEQVTQLMNKL